MKKRLGTMWNGGAARVAGLLLVAAVLGACGFGFPPAADDSGAGSQDGGGTVQRADGGDISGTYDSDLTLESNTRYTVTGTITMRAVLTIEPGALLEFEAGTFLNIDDSTPEGRIRAIGTPDNPIIFRGTTESAGWWRGLLVQSTDLLNRIEHVEIYHGGSAAIGGQTSSIVVDGATAGALAVVQTAVKSGLGNGLFVEDGATLIEFSANTFGDLSESPVRLVPDEIAKLDEASTYLSTNAKNRVEIDRFGTVSANATWSNPGVPYYVTDELVIAAALTLNAGTEFQFASDVILRVNRDGALIADASGGAAITFAGETASPGFWRGIQIDSDDVNNIMDNVTISDAGAADGMSGSEEANLYLYGGLEPARLTLRNTVISNGASHGVAYDSNAVLTDGANSPPSLTGVTFVNVGDDNTGFSDYAPL